MRAFLAALAVLVGLLPGTAIAQGAPASGEFQVNSYTTADQVWPSLAADSSGNFVIVWNSDAQDGSAWGVFGQRYSSSGTKLGTEFRVNSYTTDDQVDPAAASDPYGNFVVVWSNRAQDGSPLGVFGQRYLSAGAPLGAEFPVSSTAGGRPVDPSIAADSSSNFVVVWSSNNQDGSGYGVFAQRFGSSGATIGPEFQVNSSTANDQRHPRVAFDASGNFVVVWHGSGQDNSGDAIRGQRYASSGAALGSEFQANSYTTQYQSFPSIASAASGDFVVVWRSFLQDGSYSGVFAQRYASSGARLGSEFQVNTYTTSWQDRPSVTADPYGNFVVVWQSNKQDGDGYGVVGQRYAASGERLGTEFQVNTYTTSWQYRPAVTADPSGRFVVAWSSVYQDGSRWGVFGRRYERIGFAPPVADFTFGADPVATKPVQFTDTSTGSPTAWSWTFGDGGTSTLQNPSHTYATAGTFQVSLTATNEGGPNTKTRSVVVILPVAADFTVSANPVATKPVQFTDTSTGSPTSWSWTFGDGGTSTSQSPTHTYATAGTFQVSLTAGNAGGPSTKTQSVIVIPPVVAAFTVSANPVAGKPVQFTDTSTGSPTSWSWTFGDGGTSTSQSPAHTYASAGTFQVALTASNVGGPSTKTLSILVILPVVADFTVSANPVAARPVQFTDTSTGLPTAWSWTFGDGGTSTSQSPTHTYTSAGTFQVALTASNVGGPSTKTQSVVVVPALTASFTVSTPALSGEPVQFTDTSTVGPTSWSWTFGDGTASTAQSPPHVYLAAGSYSVTLAISRGIVTSTSTQTVSVGVGTTLILAQRRVSVTVDWQDPYSGKSGKALATPQQDTFGFFYFSDPLNPEVFVKVLDFGQGGALCFVGGLSDFAYRVTFTTLRTGQTLVFTKPAFQYVGFADNGTLRFGRGRFAAPEGGSPAGEMTFVGSLPLDPGVEDASAAGPIATNARAQAAALTLALSNGRVSVTVDWQDPYSGKSGTASAIPQQDTFGFFYFTDPSNPEVFVKVLDFGQGGALCFVGGLSDFFYRVTFRTLRTDQALVFTKPAFQFIGFADNGTLKF